MKYILTLILTLNCLSFGFAQGLWQQKYAVKGLATIHQAFATDIDNDGLQDIMIGTSGDLSWWKNLGNEYFSQQPVITLAQTTQFFLHDINSDGFPDIFTNSFTFYLNDGTGKFENTIIPGIGGYTLFAFEDFDNDGDQDVILRINGQESLRLYMNDGNLNFSFAQSIGSGYSTSFLNAVKAVDMDNNGFADLVLATDENVVLFPNIDGTLDTSIGIINSGADVFNVGDWDNDDHMDLVYKPQSSDNIFTRIQNENMSWSSATLVGECFSSTGHIEVLDTDNDGDLDLIFPKTHLQSWVFTNNGGSFSENSTFSSSITTPELRSIDLDEDGDQDLLSIRPSTNGAFPKIARHLYSNGQFANKEGISYHFTDGQTPKFSADDIDNDGDNDLIISNDGELLLSINAGNGNLTIPKVFAEANTGNTVTLDDMNQDGFSDFLAVTPTNEIAWYINNQTGGFSQGTIVGDFTHSFHRNLAVADLDGDGDKDILGGSSDNEVAEINLYLNNGANAYEQITLANENNFNFQNFIVADYDNDGDFDFAGIAFGSNQVLVFTNAGNATFTRTVLNFFDPITTLNFVDTNDNGFLEIITTESASNGVYIYKRSFNGIEWNELSSFNNLLFFNLTTEGMGLCHPEDLNGDGIMDLVFAIDFIKTGSQSFVSRAGYALGTGDGEFSDPEYFYEYNTYAHNYRHLLTADMNGDGSPDPLLHFYAEGLNVNFANDEYDNLSYFVNNLTATSSIDTLNLSVKCNNSGTPETSEDDYLQLDMTVADIFASTKFSISSSEATIEPSLAVYDTPHSFKVSPTVAEGENITITLTDLNDTNLSMSFTIIATYSCTDFTQVISSEVSNIACFDNETSNDSTDDIITFDLTTSSINGTFTGDYILNGENLEETTDSYNATNSYASIAGAAGTGNLNLTLTDANNDNLTLNIIVTDSGSCSLSTLENENSNLKVYLNNNLSKDDFHFYIDNLTSPHDYEIIISDVSGKIKQSRLLNSESLLVNAANWNKGLYIYYVQSVKTGRVEYSGKFIKF